MTRMKSGHPSRYLTYIGPSHSSEFKEYLLNMATHSSTLAWKIPWTKEPGGLQSMGSLRVGHDWATSLSLFTFMHWRRKCQPIQCSCLENLRDRGAWWAAIYGVEQSQTWLKRLSSSSSSSFWENHRVGKRENHFSASFFPDNAQNFVLIGSSPQECPGTWLLPWQQRNWHKCILQKAWDLTEMWGRVSWVFPSLRIIL